MALLYPNLSAAVADISHPAWRGSAIGIYRFWRDLGYAIGALVAGLIADAFGFAAAIVAIAGLTFLSGVVSLFAMQETRVAGRDDERAS